MPPSICHVIKQFLWTSVHRLLCPIDICKYSPDCLQFQAPLAAWLLQLRLVALPPAFSPWPLPLARIGWCPGPEPFEFLLPWRIFRLKFICATYENLNARNEQRPPSGSQTLHSSTFVFRQMVRHWPCWPYRQPGLKFQIFHNLQHILWATLQLALALLQRLYA